MREKRDREELNIYIPPGYEREEKGTGRGKGSWCKLLIWENRGKGKRKGKRKGKNRRGSVWESFRERREEREAAGAVSSEPPGLRSKIGWKNELVFVFPKGEDSNVCGLPDSKGGMGE